MTPPVLADQRRSDRRSRIWALGRAEVVLTMRRGESVLLNLGIPVLLLVFFSLVDVLPTDAAASDPVDFLAPGVLTLAVMSNAMVGLAIATGFERRYGVLRRLAVSPLDRIDLIGAKCVGVVAVLAVQVIVISATGVALGWRPDPAGVPAATLAAALALVGFAGIGMTMAGRLRAEATLAAANAAWFVLLLAGGVVVPLAEMPSAMADAARLVPAAALSDIVHAAIGVGTDQGASDWIVLSLWAVVTPLVAARTFRWDDPS